MEHFLFYNAQVGLNVRCLCSGKDQLLPVELLSCLYLESSLKKNTQDHESRNDDRKDPYDNDIPFHVIFSSSLVYAECLQSFPESDPADPEVLRRKGSVAFIKRKGRTDLLDVNTVFVYLC